MLQKRKYFLMSVVDGGSPSPFSTILLMKPRSEHPKPDDVLGQALRSEIVIWQICVKQFKKVLVKNEGFENETGF
jgi:hypothetical protein